MVLSIFLRRVRRSCPFISIGGTVRFSLNLSCALLTSARRDLQGQVGTVAAATLATFFLVRALCRPDPVTLARSRSFFPPQPPVDFAAETGATTNGRQLPSSARLDSPSASPSCCSSFLQQRRTRREDLCPSPSQSLAVGGLMFLPDVRPSTDPENV